MLISEAIQIVHLISQGNTDYPSSGDDDFSLMLSLINNGINVWEHQENVVWDELFDLETGTISNGDDTYSLSTEFKLPATQLRLYSSNSTTPIIYNYNSPNEEFLTQAMDSSARRFTVTGVQGSKVLTVYPVPGVNENGMTWKLGCYREATKYSTGQETTAIDMRDPYFAIHFAISQLMLEDNPTLAGVHQQIANQKLISMRIANDTKPIGSTEDNYDLMGGWGT